MVARGPVPRPGGSGSRESAAPSPALQGLLREEGRGPRVQWHRASAQATEVHGVLWLRLRRVRRVQSEGKDRRAGARWRRKGTGVRGLLRRWHRQVRGLQRHGNQKQLALPAGERPRLGTEGRALALQCIKEHEGRARLSYKTRRNRGHRHDLRVRLGDPVRKNGALQRSHSLPVSVVVRAKASLEVAVRFPLLVEDAL